MYGGWIAVVLDLMALGTTLAVEDLEEDSNSG